MNQISNLLGALVAAVCIGATAQIAIPLPENFAAAPITGQTLAVTISAFLLGKKWGSIAILFYLILGILGAPLFSDFESGLDVFLGPSLGYFIGFLACAYFLGWWAENKSTQFGPSLLAFLIGSLLILFIGMLGLLRYFDLKDALWKGVLPFLPGAIVKVFLASILIYVIQRFKGLMNNEELRNK